MVRAREGDEDRESDSVGIDLPAPAPALDVASELSVSESESSESVDSSEDATEADAAADVDGLEGRLEDCELLSLIDLRRLNHPFAFGRNLGFEMVDPCIPLRRGIFLLRPSL